MVQMTCCFRIKASLIWSGWRAASVYRLCEYGPDYVRLPCRGCVDMVRSPCGFRVEAAWIWSGLRAASVQKLRLYDAVSVRLPCRGCVYMVRSQCGFRVEAVWIWYGVRAASVQMLRGYGTESVWLPCRGCVYYGAVAVLVLNINFASMHPHTIFRVLHDQIHITSRYAKVYRPPVNTNTEMWIWAGYRLFRPIAGQMQINH